VSAEAIQEHRVPLEDVGALVMRPGCTLACPVGVTLCFRATSA
jgi:hypothetical protein